MEATHRISPVFMDPIRTQGFPVRIARFASMTQGVGARNHHLIFHEDMTMGQLHAQLAATSVQMQGVLPDTINSSPEPLFSLGSRPRSSM